MQSPYRRTVKLFKSPATTKNENVSFSWTGPLKTLGCGSLGYIGFIYSQFKLQHRTRVAGAMLTKPYG